jgi:hypothetical protein
MFFFISLDVFVHSLSRQFQFIAWRLLRLFDEAMQQNDFLVHDRKERPRDTVSQAGANFPEAVTQVVHQRLSHRPRKLDLENVPPPPLLHSSFGKLSSHSRTGSLPDPVLKKTTFSGRPAFIRKNPYHY